jgi:tetratricopeptide (TPR) repeat protein
MRSSYELRKVTKTIKPASEQVQEKYHQAYALYQAGQLARARVIFERVLKIQPKHVDALNWLGVIEARTKSPTRALHLFDKAIELDANNAVAFCNRALTLQNLKQFDAALANYDHAIAIKPNYAEAHLNRGHALKETQPFRPQHFISVATQPSWRTGESC